MQEITKSLSTLRHCSLLAIKAHGFTFATPTWGCFGISKMQGTMRSLSTLRCRPLLGFKTHGCISTASSRFESGLCIGFWKRSLQVFIHNENTKVKCCSVPRFLLQSRFIGGKSHKEKDSQKKSLDTSFEGDKTETDFLNPSNGDLNANLEGGGSLPNQKKEGDCYISKILSTAERDFLINNNGDQDWSIDLLLDEWGSDLYPFTEGRIRELQNEEAEVMKNMSLKNLLAAAPDDFVISNTGNKVPISELEGKVVGLYIYGSFQAHNIMKNLVKIYKELKDRGENFEIVFVNVHLTEAGYNDEEMFKQKLKEMPWLALPFMHKSCRKLWNIFMNEICGGEYDLDKVLVIIGPDGEYVETDGATIIEEDGVAAYPFTKEKVAEVRRDMDGGSFLWDGNRTYFYP